ncbi:hypothetical protein QR680_007283 [Steinernema hermaphroditum]|uniref:Uncharacterized protein n=1 Tax=Steinernema hermaphroditum TaxID=289476 RepID=A0AA39I0X3_9BILA|nr:hypothetical protein QR680_007283 [Steinernema hermaphroditum]
MKLLLLSSILLLTTGHRDCPTSIRSVIEKAAIHYDDMTNRTQTIRHVLDDIMGGMWGVIVSDEDAPFYWILPNVRPYFCEHAFGGWQYVAFKTNDQDTSDRYTVEDAVRESRLLRILRRKPRDYHDEHNPCDPPIPGSVIIKPQDDYIVRRQDY